jgi:uncharacterized protein involved in response to NO
VRNPLPQKKPATATAASTMKTQSSKGTADFFAEPFRIFFPAGILIGITGVALWPMYYGNVIVVYPGIPHARLMIEGFLGSFIIGFLGTAGPRITSTSPFSRREVLVLFTLDVLAAGLHLGESHRAGDTVFLGAGKLTEHVLLTGRWKELLNVWSSAFTRLQETA